MKKARAILVTVAFCSAGLAQATDGNRVCSTNLKELQREVPMAAMLDQLLTSGKKLYGKKRDGSRYIAGQYLELPPGKTLDVGACNFQHLYRLKTAPLRDAGDEELCRRRHKTDVTSLVKPFWDDSQRLPSKKRGGPPKPVSALLVETNGAIRYLDLKTGKKKTMTACLDKEQLFPVTLKFTEDVRVMKLDVLTSLSLDPSGKIQTETKISERGNPRNNRVLSRSTIDPASMLGGGGSAAPAEERAPAGRDEAPEITLGAP